MQVKLLLNSVDRTSLLGEDWVINSNDGAIIDTLELKLHDANNSVLVVTGQDLIIEKSDDDTVRYFGGIVAEASQQRLGLGRVWSILAQDWKLILDRAVVFSKSYVNQTDQAIIQDAFTEAGVTEINTSSISVGRTIDEISFEGTTLRNIMELMISITGFRWDVDYFKVLVYEEEGTKTVDFELSDDPDESTTFPYYNFSYTEEVAQFSRIKIRGANQVSADTEDIYAGDGATILFQTGPAQQPGASAISRAPLLNFAGSANTSNRVIVELNTGSQGSPSWSTQNVGIEGQDPLSSAVPVVWNALGRSFKFNTAPSDFTNAFRIKGRYLSPLSVVIEDDARSASLGRTFTKIVNQPDIITEDAAVDVAVALMRMHGTKLYARCTTDQDAPVVGSIIKITNAIAGLTARRMLVHRMTTRLVGGTSAQYALQLVNEIDEGMVAAVT
jgi:hypothetical protein